MTGPVVTKVDLKTVVETGPTTTVTSYSTTTAITLQTVPQTIVETVSRVVQETSPTTIVVTATVQNTATIRQTDTVVTNQLITTISRVTQFVSVSATCPTTSLSGLVTCPTRITNTAYTPPTPLPSNYLWGCPPGKLCHPKREGCNFEQKPPADTYACAPEECLPVAALTPFDAYLAANTPSNDSCAWLTPIDEYFNLNPLFFGLDFGIFKIHGQETCTSACPAASTVTTQAPGSWGAWSGPAPTSASNHGSVAPPHVTKRADLSERGLAKRVVAVSGCYRHCNYAEHVWESIGKEARLCDTLRPILNSLSACNSLSSGVGVASSVASELNAPLEFCNFPI